MLCPSPVLCCTTPVIWLVALLVIAPNTMYYSSNS